VRAGIVLLALFLTACVSAGAPLAFAPNQVWRMKHPPSPDARIVIDAIQMRGDRTVVRYSVVEIQKEAVTPPAGLKNLSAPEKPGQPARPVTSHGGFDSMFLDDDGHWQPGGGSMGWGPAKTPGERSTSEIFGLASYDAVLRVALASRPEPGAALHAIFPNLDDRMSLNWPVSDEERDVVLAKPVSATLDEIAAWRRKASGPPSPPPPPKPSPPEHPAADEKPTQDAALDTACRSRFARRPEDVQREAEEDRELDTRRAAVGLPPRQHFPMPEPSYAKVKITRSPEWGVVWRADMRMGDRDSSGTPVRCWRPDANQPPRFEMSLDRFMPKSPGP
jgi:hypothetical protein